MVFLSSLGEKLTLGDELANEIVAFDEVTSATYTGKVVEVVINGYTFEVNGDLGIDDKKEIAIVEPKDINEWEWIVEEDGSATITRYKGNDTKLVIPNYIDGHWVKKIKNNDQFYGEGAIWDLDKLERVEDGTLQTFYYQNDITDIVISNGIEVLGEDCFRGVTNLKSVSIPDSVVSIEEKVFCVGYSARGPNS